MVTRVATYTSHTLLSNLALRNAANVTDLNTQASSGYKSRNYSGIADSSQRLLNLEAEYTRTEQYLRNTTQAKLRLQNMESAVDTISSIAVKIKSLLVQSLSANQADDVNLDNEAKQAMEQISNLLNTNLDGRYLFAGGRSELPAVDIDKMYAPDNYMSESGVTLTDATTLASLGVTDGEIQIVSTDVNGASSTSTVDYDPTTWTIADLRNAINGNTTDGAIATLRGLDEHEGPRLNIENVGNGTITITEIAGGNILNALGMTKIPNPRPDTSYYTGDQQILEARIDDQYDVSYGILADDPAFQSLIQGLGIAAATTDQDALNVAMGHISDAINNLPNIQGKIGLDIANIERFETRHEDYKIFAAQAISDIETVDVPLTLAELSQYETALQASFITISKSSDLSLANYLR
ncbi:flagellin [Thalassospira alkalitolerans]|uniref:flagellin N-terminal helical domain-containing protein n=1 Tax=Thalassospira alkalitolerans TaxID=1293890 RepID=UPI000A1DCC14|nr:flagellin [Thalassospira alkalitolerans]|tara:strand:- start:1282 stop:2511 length:1230 start_codon:yes stop_codon:yes gene_type:complete